MRTITTTPTKRKRRSALALVLGFVIGSFGVSGIALAQGDHGAEAEQPGHPEHPDEAGDAGITTGGGEGHESGHGHGHHEDPSRDFNWVKGLNPFGQKLDIKGGPMGDGKLGDRPLTSSEKEEPMSAPFVLMVLNFVVLLVILAKFGGPAARKMAESRSDQIKSALDDASKLRDQAKAKLDEYTAKLAASDAEIKKMIDGIRADAEEDRKRVMATAEAQAIALKKDAEERIAAEISRARHALSREVAIAAASAAEKLLKDKTTAGDQTKLVDGFISDLGGSVAAPRERS
jgi:F-type H+-transporting ATPase subunit b